MLPRLRRRGLPPRSRGGGGGGGSTKPVMRPRPTDTHPRHLPGRQRS
jgi:hypothetical protein